MKRLLLKLSTSFLMSLVFIGTFSSCGNKKDRSEEKTPGAPLSAPITLVIHGGAGEIKPGFLSEKQEEEYRSKLSEALNAGYEILAKGGNSVDAVEASITVMEDSPLFNAAKGSVLTHEGKVSMDASIMEGKTLNAGAVSGIEHVKNPITLTRLVIDSSKHVFLSGEGAEEFAGLHNLEMEENDYFITPRRWEQLQEKLSENSAEKSTGKKPGDKYGTVGCVAIDKHGTIAAGTSTGGMVNKRFGRIGDSPVIGAGTYADNETCGISATGHGEYFIRLSVAKSISDIMKYANKSLEAACKEVIQVQLAKLGGTGGVIAIDKDGNYHFEFNTPGMYRGVIRDGNEEIKFYKN